MDVFCPQGQSCRGATKREIPKCILSEQGPFPPSFLRRTMRKELKKESIVIRVLHEYMLQSDLIMYYVYQCPSCGIRVVFREYEGSNGRVFERLGDELEMS